MEPKNLKEQFPVSVELIDDRELIEDWKSFEYQRSPFSDTEPIPKALGVLP